MSNNQYNLEGKILLIHETQTFASGFTKREFVVETGDKYPQPIKLEVHKDRCSELEALSPGDLVDVRFNIRGNEYKDRHYVNLLVWRIDRQGEASQPQQRTLSQPPAKPGETGTLDYDTANSPDEDIPF